MRKQRLLSCIHPILTMNQGRLAHARSDFIHRYTKGMIEKSCTRILQVHYHHKHIYHRLTMHCINQQTIIEILPPQFSSSKFQIRRIKKEDHNQRQTQSIDLRQIRSLIQQEWNTQLIEDRNYYQYHPYQAKQLAISYLKHVDTTRLVAEYFHDMRINRSLRSTSITPFYIKSMQIEHMDSYKYAPVFRDEVVQMVHRSMEPYQQQHPSQADKENEKVKEEAPMPKIDIARIVYMVTHEMEKRQKREQARRGRR